MRSLDRDRVDRFLGQVVDDVGSALHGALTYIGDRLGLFRTLGDSGPVTVEELAERTGLSPRYLAEWLNAMTAAQYVEHDAGTGTYLLPAEHAAVLAEESFPLFVGGFLEFIVPAVLQAPKVLEAFRSGKGVPQREYPPE